MRHKHLRDTRISKLSTGRVKGIGFFEGIVLKITGRIDGTRNLPRECDDGHWISPHLDREVHSYDEFSSRMWGQLQIEEEDEYVRLGALMDSIVHTKAQLKTARAELKDALAYEGVPSTSRKHGESKLTEAQVATRRANERAKRLAVFRSRIGALQSRFDSKVDEFLTLRNKIIEDNNSTRMICTRVKEHLLQRMDVYWNAALHKHSENARMPAVPSIEVTSRAEIAYMELHKVLMQKAEMIGQSLSKDETEVAYNVWKEKESGVV